MRPPGLVSRPSRAIIGPPTMRLSLQSYFDVGVSFGLGDAAFRATPAMMVPDILAIGIRNPLGEGIVSDLNGSAPLVVWTHKASAIR
jgi:hypothetical protein